MDVITTLKVNNEKGELLHSVKMVFSDDIGYTLDEFITRYGEHVEEYLLNQIKPDKNDEGPVILRYHYLALMDKIEHKRDDGIIAEHDDGTIMYNLTSTNERVILHFGDIRMLSDDEVDENYKERRTTPTGANNARRR